MRNFAAGTPPLLTPICGRQPASLAWRETRWLDAASLSDFYAVLARNRSQRHHTVESLSARPVYLTAGTARLALSPSVSKTILWRRGALRRAALRGNRTVFTSPRPIGRYYPPSYSPYRPAIQDERSAAMRWMRRRKLVKRRQAVERHAPRRPGDLLDVGCSTGIFMDEMRSAGWRVTGVEMVREAAEYAHARFGLPVVEGDLLEVGLAPQSFDAITLFDVLEHPLNRRQCCIEPRSACRPAGSWP